MMKVNTLDLAETKMDFSGFKVNRSVYATASEQLEEYIKTEILSKNLPSGYRLPNTSEIVEMVNVGAVTVRQAMNNLSRAGLIESTPGKGTFVSANAALSDTILGESSSVSNRTTRFGVIGSLAGAAESLWYRQQTITGIVKQSDQSSSDIILLNNLFKNRNFDEAYSEITEAECDVFIWLYPEPYEWGVIESLQRLDIPLVITRYSHGNDDIPSVELDTEQAGFEVGAYFASQGCSRITSICANKTDFVSPTAIKHGCWPNNIESGLIKAYRYLMPSTKSPVNVEVVGSDYARASDILNDILKVLPEKEGLFFGDSIQLAHYIQTYKEDALKSLEGKILVSTINNNSLAVYSAIGINFPIMTLTFPFEEIGCLAIQKANNLLSGHMNGTATLLRLPLKEYKNDSFINDFIEELNSRSEQLNKS